MGRMWKLALLVLTIGCTGATEPRQVPGLDVVTEATAYEAGDRVAVQLSNRTDQQIGHNLCFAFLTLERRTGTRWTPADVSLAPGPNTACIGPLYRLAPGEAAEGAAYLPLDLPPGRYRLLANVEIARQALEIATNAFSVEST